MSIHSQLRITAAGISDLEILRELGIATFMESFAADNTEENMNMYLAQAFPKARILAEINDPRSAFYLARIEEKAIGYLKLQLSEENFKLNEEGENSSESVETRIRASDHLKLSGNSDLEIERIYVLKEYHGTGIGQALLDFALDFAQTEGCGRVWLGVWEHNPRAIRFYEKNGFRAFGSHEFVLGLDRQNDILMERYIY
jgi:ribosomal protein S18 acetylase RimI-like enzyme